MTIAVDLGRKATEQTKQRQTSHQANFAHSFSHCLVLALGYPKTTRPLLASLSAGAR